MVLTGELLDEVPDVVLCSLVMLGYRVMLPLVLLLPSDVLMLCRGFVALPGLRRSTVSVLPLEKCARAIPLQQQKKKASPLIIKRYPDFLAVDF